MTCKNKIGFWIKNLKSKTFKFFCNILAGCNNFLKRFFKIYVVFYGLCPHNYRRKIHSIWIIGKLDAIQRFYKRSISHCKTNSKSCKRPWLWKSTNYKQVIICMYKRKYALSSKINVCFIHNDYGILMSSNNLFYISCRLI